MNRVLGHYVGICVFFIYCQSGFGQVLSLKQAVSEAILSYPTLKAQQSGLEAVRMNVRIVKENRLPNVRLHDQVNLGTANGLSGSYFSLGLIVPTAGGRRPDNSMELVSGNIALATADWEVYNFGRFDAENRMVNSDVSLAEASVDREGFALQQSVIKTYLDLIWLNQNLTIEKRNLSRIDTARKIISNLVQNGIRPGLDSSLVAVEFSRARLNYFQLKEEFQKGLVMLATFTGHSVNGLEIDTTFNEKMLNNGASNSQLETSHPFLRYRTTLINRQYNEIEVIRKSALPRISLLTSVWARGTSLDIDNNFGPLGNGFGYSRTNFLLGVAATVNLTDFRRTKTRIMQQRWRIRESNDQLEVEKIQLKNMLITSDSLLITLRMGLQELPSALSAADLAYQQRLSLYNSGIENILGLTDALQLLTTVERQSVDLQRRAVNVWLQRAYATGEYDTFFTLFQNR